MRSNLFKSLMTRKKSALVVSIAAWFWESDGAHLTLRRCADGDYLLLIGVEDVPQFVADLQELAALSTPKGDTDHER